ncbi:site-specific DNA-methyltransferase [Mycolicibacterium conceptionense]|uniref:DNA-methyltransferase n=1 Tax=Mycolicibacterium conceptionense TaxID=451644 RepID=UPI00336B7A9E
MKPYYQDDQVTLYHGDCLEITDWLAADVLVTDPPYGISHKQRFGSATNPRQQHYSYNVVAGDHNPALRDDTLALWGDKPAIVFGSWRIERPPKPFAVLVWHKAGAMPGQGRSAFMTAHEEIYVLGSGWRASSPPLMSVLTTREHRPLQARETGHPTSKPIALMERLIDRCPPGVIAEPFAGSGSTLIAAVNQGRKAIGVELEERYCELIANRLQNQTMTLDFGNPA